MRTYAFRIICKLAGNYDDFEITEGKIPLVLPAFASLIHVGVFCRTPRNGIFQPYASTMALSTTP
jgi:hypothetical protein